MPLRNHRNVQQSNGPGDDRGARCDDGFDPVGEVVPHDAATLGLYDPATDALMVQFLAPDEGGVPLAGLEMRLW